MPESAISISSVTRSYGKVVAVGGVSLDVAKGSILGLVGANGAGKTTLLRLLVGALRPDAGTVRVLGDDPYADRRKVRARIGYMPQAPVLYQDLSVQENVSFFARGHIVPNVEAQVNTVLEFVDLVGEADRPVRNLSGGQQQRVSLAATLAHEPEVVFLDEPTAGVDPELRHTFWQHFRRLADAGTTIVVSTHQMDEVVHCDRVAILRRGTVLADATPAELFSSGGATVRIHSDDEIVERQVGSLADDLPGLLRNFGLDPGVTRIEVREPTLEEVVLGLIGRREDGDDGR